MKKNWLEWAAILSIASSLAILSACESGSSDDDDDTDGTGGTSTTTVTSTTTLELVAPALTQPDDGVGGGTTVMFGWMAVEGAAKYRLEVQRDDGGSWTTQISNTNITILRTFTLTAGNTYRWRVVPIDNLGIDGPASVWRTYTCLL